MLQKFLMQDLREFKVDYCKLLHAMKDKNEERTEHIIRTHALIHRDISIVLGEIVLNTGEDEEVNPVYMKSVCDLVQLYMTKYEQDPIDRFDKNFVGIALDFYCRHIMPKSELAAGRNSFFKKTHFKWNGKEAVIEDPLMLRK